MTSKNRLRPQDGEAQVSLCDVGLEQSALAAAMLSPSQAKELIAAASPELFSITFTRDVFTAICALGPDCLDYPLLAHELERSGKHFNLGDLACLDNGVVVEIPMTKRIVRLKELHRLRELARLGERLAEMPFEIGAKSDLLIVDIEAQLEAISR